MASSSKKCLNPSDISRILESNELVERLADSDEIELLNIDESSESDFCDKEDDMLLRDSGDLHWGVWCSDASCNTEV
jgi:hypothetical protein